MRTITMKFGGTSVGSVDAIRHVTHIVRREIDAGHRVVTVVSAMSGVTDLLLSSVEMAIAGDKWGYMSVAEKLRDRHEDTLKHFVRDMTQREKVMASLEKLINEYVELCHAINVLGEGSPRIHDAITSFGERLSCRLVAAALVSAGVNARHYDATQFIVTDDTYQSAIPLWDETQQRIRNHLLPVLDNGIVPVITGFIGATRRGTITTLGRGGSDFSGAIFAAYTHSDELIIWTDVDGVMTTDPRIDPRARVLPYVSYQEVGELAYYGAKVLHPKTVQPILNAGIPMRVRNTFNNEHPGTLISAHPQHSSTIIKAVTSIRRVSMLTVSGRGMLGVPGIAGRTFIATARANANILMISQSSSEQSFCFLVVDDRAEAAKHAIEEELRTEIANQHVDSVDVMDDVVIITIVGSGMRGTPGIAGRVFTIMGETGINVLSIAQGSSECSISFVIKEADMERAVTRLHDLALEGAG